MVSTLHLSLCFLLSVWHAVVNSVADGTVGPSSVFRDDMLFDIQWPGGYAKRLESNKADGIGAGEMQLTRDKLSNNILPAGLSDQLLSEVKYSEPEYLEMKSVHDENYICEMPHWTASGDEKDSEGVEDEMNSPQELIKSLRSRCTRLAMGYWTYELCHGLHVKQFHETKEVKKEPKKPGDALDEYLLGMLEPEVSKTHSIDTDSKSSQLESADQQDKKNEKVIPVWLYHGNEYPYYEVQFGGGTPCDLKEGTHRSTGVRYICDRNSHSTGTLLQLEEVSTCKYEAVVAISNLCQNKHYRLREDPIYPLKCFSKEGSPTKPKSLLEHEIIMAQYSQRKRSKQPKSYDVKDTKKQEKQEEEDEKDEKKDYEMKDKSRDFPTSRTHSDYLDENFIRSFLSGGLCLRGGAGWWQHEVCYGKSVKQVHEEMGKAPVEVVLGSWVEEGHRRWFSSSSTSKRQSKSFVIHLYMKGDLCEVTGVPRQCQVKFRCSSSSRLSEVSIYLEEPTTCNYILTVEAAFLCPLLKNTDELGMFSFPSGGIESLEKAMEKKDRDHGGEKNTKDTEKDSIGGNENPQEQLGIRDGNEKRTEGIIEQRESSDQGKQHSKFDRYDSEDELDVEGNSKVKRKGEKEDDKRSEQESTDKKRN